MASIGMSTTSTSGSMYQTRCPRCGAFAVIGQLAAFRKPIAYVHDCGCNISAQTVSAMFKNAEYAQRWCQQVIASSAEARSENTKTV